MATIDWLIFVAPWFLIFLIGRHAKRYVRDVPSFLSGGRAAGRYLICVGEGMAGIGVISVVGMFEVVYSAGFTMSWWANLSMPVMVFLALSGFVIFRYRETRVLTMAQFFEIRYTRRFRIFMGLLSWGSGVLNYAIFPAVSARFFVYFCGLPESLKIFGQNVPTFAVLMFFFLSLSLYLVLMGGQLQVMVTDCVQGILSGILFLVVIGAVLRTFSFEQFFQGLSSGGTGSSLLNPFDTGRMADFNIWYVLIGIFGSIYNYMSWQGSQGFNSCALNPHEAKMGKILAGWRSFAQTLMITLLAIAAVTYMKNPDFAWGSARVSANLAQIENPYLQTQMTVPLALADFLPVGIRGVLAAIMMFMMVSTDTSYLHSWGSIFVQDVLLPLRGRPLDTKRHLVWLRCSIAAVAVFAFFFSLLFRQTDYIFMYFAITGALFLGGSGAAIIGGLYWKKGTSSAAWVSMVLGATIATFGILVRQFDPHFPLNGQTMWLIAMVSSLASYAFVSLLTCRENFNMDRLLHRGIYSVVGDASPSAGKKPGNWKRVLLGFDESFTLGDKTISITLSAWTWFWFLAFAAISLMNLAGWSWGNRTWWNYHMIQGIIAPLIIGPVTTIWFTIGGVKDIIAMFDRLSEQSIDENDDGAVRLAESIIRDPN